MRTAEVTGPLLVLFTLLLPAPAAAQPSGAAALPAWDAGAIIGSFSGHAAVPDFPPLGYSDDWYHTGEGGVFIARRWTTHFRTELGLATSGEGRQTVPRLITLPGQSAPVPYSAAQHTQVSQVTVTAAWQFFDNQWVHPFLEGGIAVDTQRTRVLDPGFIYYADARTPVTVAGRAEELRTETTARALVGAGVKLYMTSRFFFRADARGVMRSRFEHLSLRSGLGVDF
jgi:hypothetical protein